jgi:hypothetical protein
MPVHFIGRALATSGMTPAKLRLISVLDPAPHFFELVQGKDQAYQLPLQHEKRKKSADAGTGNCGKLGNFFLFPTLKRKLAGLTFSLDEFKKTREGGRRDTDQRRPCSDIPEVAIAPERFVYIYYG